MKLSACLVIRNEEKLLARCLESIKNIVDEIIIIHDGKCTDHSLIIAKQYKAKIWEKEFIGEAEWHRPFAFSQCRGEWILQIDGDEFLSTKAQKEIPQLIKSREIDAYSFLWPYFDGKNLINKGPFSKTYKQCLFRKEKMYMLGIAHEYPKTYGRQEKIKDLLLINMPMTNNYSDEAFRKKWSDWAKLQARQIWKIEQAPVFNIKQKDDNSVYNYYLYMRKHPIMSGVKEMVKFILIYILRGIIWSNFISYKIAFMEIKYLWLVRYYLLFLKNGRRV